MNRPSPRLAIEFNKRVREDDEWFDEPDDLDRMEQALSSLPSNDRVTADLLVQAASGADVERDIISVLMARA